MLCVKQCDIKYHFWVFGLTRPGIEPQSPGPLANTLLIRPPIWIFFLLVAPSIYQARDLLIDVLKGKSQKKSKVKKKKGNN